VGGASKHKTKQEKKHYTMNTINKGKASYHMGQKIIILFAIDLKPRNDRLKKKNAKFNSYDRND
jgi:hypothetical protein